ncbi:hypothetical protein R3P38DRAFT_2875584 [Favolaschia claudopus]|uniref:Uncharacterized protein n=1 Tax=Favolaschia claudopus TaxID=2862362 RepID=A0AAW0D793_9AGAR
MSSKRHSMPVGPRPLQLANGPIADALPSAPLSATSPYSSGLLSPSTPTTPNGGPRRQSSITYNPATRPSRPVGHRSSLQRSNSVGNSLDLKKNLLAERSPVTLAEKHADLLHFIAQKESKCLELRSQLAMHEAELLQLKRKWERIVSRGFTSPHNPTTLPSTVSTSSSLATTSLETSPNQPTSANGAAVLDGIREGVQGVGRFIAALSPTSASSAYHSPSFSSSATPISSSFDAMVPRSNGTHSKTSSMSTNMTTTTTSTRFSQSSQSSLGEECATPEEEEDADGAQVLMVHDTGATPTMSPNPAFSARRQQQQNRERERQPSATGTAGDSSAEAEEDFFFAQAQVQASIPPVRPISSKRVASTSAIPGLALVDGIAPASVSAWVGSVGKKWEELQKVPTFAKNSKRASLLFSDIANALQVGPTPVASPSPSPSHAPPSPAMTASTTTTSQSLLDDDDNEMRRLPAAPLNPLTPTLKPTPRTRQQQPQSPLTVSKSKVPPKPKPPTQPAKIVDDDDEEWNW